MHDANRKWFDVRAKNGKNCYKHEWLYDNILGLKSTFIELRQSLLQ